MAVKDGNGRPITLDQWCVDIREGDFYPSCSYCEIELDLECKPFSIGMMSDAIIRHMRVCVYPHNAERCDTL